MDNDWKLDKWGNIISLEYGKALRGYQNYNGKYKVYGANGPVGWTDDPIAKGPGVILGRKGANRGVAYSEDPFFVIDTAYYVKPKIDLHMRWLYYAIKGHKLGEIDDGSPIPSTTRSAVYVREVRVPPIEEQRAIAHILGTLDDKIELNRRMNRTLEQMAQAIFKSWFIDFDPVVYNAVRAGNTVPERFAETAARYREQPELMKLPEDVLALFPDRFVESELGDVPVGWGVSTVGKHFMLTMGQSPPGYTYNEEGDGLPFFQGRRDFGFRFPSERVYCTEPKRIANSGDTLISVRAPVGDINMAFQECCVGRGVAAIRHNKGLSSFTFYSMKALTEQFKSYEGEGTVFGSINKRQFEGLFYLVPDKKIIEKFEYYVQTFDNSIYNNSEQDNSLDYMRDVLLTKLISGEIRVSNGNEIVEKSL